MTRKERGRGLTSIEFCIDASMQGLEDYIKKSKERLIQQPVTVLTTYGQRENSKK